MKHEKIAIYCRFSSDSDEQKANSVDRQMELVNAAIGRAGQDKTFCETVWVGADEGKSGVAFKPKHDELRRLVEEGLQIDAILIDDLSRLSRYEGNDFYKENGWIIDAGIDVRECCSGQMVSVKFSGMESLITNIKQIQNHAFLEKLSKDQTSGTIAKAKKGELPPARLPLGLEKEITEGRDEKGNPTVVKSIRHSEDAKWVLPIFETYNETGNMTDCIPLLAKTSAYSGPNRRTSKLRNGDIVPTQPQTQVVRNLLRNSLYCGIYAFGLRSQGKFSTIKEVKHKNTKGKADTNYNFNRLKEAEYQIDYSDIFEPLVPRELWDKVQDKLDQNKGGPGVSKGQKQGKYKYSGKLKCAHCGSTLYGVTNGGKISYLCGNSQMKKNRTTTCEAGSTVRKSISESQVDSVVENLMGKFLEDKDFHKKCLKDAIRFVQRHEWSQAEGRQKLLDELDSREKALDALFADPDALSSAPMMERMKKLSEEISQKKEFLASTEDENWLESFDEQHIAAYRDEGDAIGEYLCVLFSFASAIHASQKTTDSQPSDSASSDRLFERFFGAIQKLQERYSSDEILAGVDALEIRFRDDGRRWKYCDTKVLWRGVKSMSTGRRTRRADRRPRRGRGSGGRGRRPPRPSPAGRSTLAA